MQYYTNKPFSMLTIIPESKFLTTLRTIGESDVWQTVFFILLTVCILFK